MTADLPAGSGASSTGRGIGHAGLSFGATLLLGLVSAVVISRVFGVEVIGAVALASAPLAVLPPLSTLGEQTAFVRSIAHEASSSPRPVSLFIVVLCFSTLLTALAGLVVAAVSVALLRGPVDRPQVVGPALVLVLGYLVLGNVSWNLDRLLSAVRGTRALLFSRLLDVSFLLLASVVAGLWLGPRVSSLVGATVLTMVPSLALRLWFVRRLVPGRPTRAALRSALAELPDLVRFGSRTVPGPAASAVAMNAGTYLLGGVTTVAALGAYSRANNLASRINEAGYRLSEVLLPVLSQAAHEGRFADAAEAFAKWRLFITVALLGGCSALAGPAKGLLGVFGPGFSEGWLVMGMLLFAYSFGVVNVVHGDLLVALGYPSAASTLALVRSALTLVLLVPLTVWAGIEGAAAALLLAFAVELCCIVVVTDRRLARREVQAAGVPWLRIALAAGLSMLAGKVLDDLSTSLLIAVGAAAASAVVYVSAIIGLRIVDVSALRALLRSRTSAVA